MQLERTKRLIEELRAYRDQRAMPQMRLAAELNLSPANLSEIMRGNNSPNSETTLLMIELQESQFMSTPAVFELKPDRPPRVEDPDHPRTLARAIARIDELNAELRQLRGNPSPTATGAAKPVAPATKPTTPAPAASKPVAPTNSTQMIYNPGKPLSEMSEIEKLRAQLDTAAPEQRAELYGRIKQLEGDAALRAFKAGRR